ncbi:phytanoyl-CoA dioxygenase family protein [Micromonospora lupini]|uniref:phytanoyl-CoA dioxygenase family protein n=1 Tax=Micromonospora lupini TaxID=285679 RepID=UPI0033E4A402
MTIPERVLEDYRDNGFAVLRGVVDTDLLAELDQHVTWLGHKYPDLRPEDYHHPLMRDDAFWVRTVTDPRLVDVAEAVLGPDLALFTAHYVCKPPRDGRPVLWHQDGAYWNLEPMEALTVWLAVDPSTRANGCLRIIPGSHRIPLFAPESRNDVPNMLRSATAPAVVDEWAAKAGIVDIELAPGDVSIHHPNILHCSKPNTSAMRRCGLDMGFMSTATAISNHGLYLDPILVRGRAVPGVNRYRDRPRYVSGESIEFRGHETWNARLADRPAAAVPDESPLEITHRMIERLKAGTVKR